MMAPVAGWLVSVIAAADAQNACLFLLLLTAEDSDGALSVLRKCLGLAKTQMLFLRHFVCLSSALPLLCVQNGTHMLFQGPLLSWLQWECSGRLLGVPKLGSSAFEERYLSYDALPHLMWFTATGIWDGCRGSPILSLEIRHSLSPETEQGESRAALSLVVSGLLSLLLGKLGQEDASFPLSGP